MAGRNILIAVLSGILIAGLLLISASLISLDSLEKSIVSSESFQYDSEQPLNQGFSSAGLASPFKRVSEDNIEVYSDKVIIRLDNPKWARFTDTNSMVPIIDSDSHAIEIEPKSASDIHIGDIVSYESPYVSGTLIHRVIEISDDSEWYAIVKGDNNPYPDPGKVRFSQIKRVLVAVIY